MRWVARTQSQKVVDHRSPAAPLWGPSPYNDFVVSVAPAEHGLLAQPLERTYCSSDISGLPPYRSQKSSRIDKARIATNDLGRFTFRSAQLTQLKAHERGIGARDALKIARGHCRRRLVSRACLLPLLEQTESVPTRIEQQCIRRTQSLRSIKRCKRLPQLFGGLPQRLDAKRHGIRSHDYQASAKIDPYEWLVGQHGGGLAPLGLGLGVIA
eukprot:scaffold259638_cov37-Tisochrysis_lutea.AAC.2